MPRGNIASQYNLLTILPGESVLANGIPSLDHDREGRLKSPQINRPSYFDLDAEVKAANISVSSSTRFESGGR